MKVTIYLKKTKQNSIANLSAAHDCMQFNSTEKVASQLKEPV